MTTLLKQRQPNLKNIFESLEILSELHKDHYVVVEKPNSPIDKILANFTKDSNKGFSLKFEDQSHHHFDFGDIEHLNITSQKYNLYFEKVFIISISPPSITGSISNFQTNGFNKEKHYHYRLFIPLKKKTDFHFYISHFTYETKKHRSSECLRINYKELDIDLYLYNDKEKGANYLILDTSTKCSFDQFSAYCFSSLVSFGYVTGKFPQDEGYFFAYDKPDLKEPIHIYYTEFRDSINSMYSPIYGNAYGYIRESKLAERIYPTLRTLTLNEFSKLCQWTHTSVDFSSILLLIIEASTSSLLVMPSGFSVALEGLTDLIVKKNESKLAPIKDKKLAKEIRTELKSVIDKYSEKIEKVGQQILKNRIDNINQLTNQSKLTKPFEVLKFQLTNEDIIAIEHRNDFLHGRINLALGEDTKNANKEIYYVSLRLYTLLSVLILKSIGYDNKIVNYPKIHEDIYKKILNEDHFRQL
ncbi:hypothetical protein [Halpernia sp. GG3]